MASLLPLPRAIFYGPDGAPLNGGWVWTYATDGATLKFTFQDAAETTRNANPTPLDADGTCVLMGEGQYKIDVRDAGNNVVFAYYNQVIGA